MPEEKNSEESCSGEVSTGSGYLDNHFPEDRNGVKDRENPSNAWIHSGKCILQLQKEAH